MITSNHDLCYMETASFIIHIKTEDVYRDIAKEVKARFDTSNFKLDKPFPKRKNEKVNGLMKDELGRKALINFSSLIPKNFSYLTDDSNEKKKCKKHREVCHQTEKWIWGLKTLFRFKSTWKQNKPVAKNNFDGNSFSGDHEEIIKHNELISKSKQRFRSKKRNAFTSEVKKTTFCAIKDKIKKW